MQARHLTLWLSALLFTTHTSAAWLLDLEGGAAWAPKADVQVPNDATGSFFSMPDDLGKASAQAFGRARLTWEIDDRNVVSALVAPLSFDFAGTLGSDIRFAGDTFGAGTAVTGKYRFNSYRFTYRYNLIKRENLTFGMGLTAKIRDAEISVSSGQRTATDANIGLVPLIHFWVDWRLAPRWHLLFNGDAAAASQGRAEDIALALQYDATETTALRLGYRVLEGGADSDDVETFALFHYATVGVTWKF